MQERMEMILDKFRRWLLPVVAVLFVLEMLTLPLAMGHTYAGKSTAPKRVVTYKRAHGMHFTMSGLSWDSSVNVDANGAALLDLFEDGYVPGTESIAPGSAGGSVVRLKNEVYVPLDYMVVIYQVESENMIPLRAEITADKALQAASEIVMPRALKKAQILDQKTGQVPSRGVVDFGLNWFWDYEISDEQNTLDTYLGSLEGKEATIGFYIVVQEEGETDWSSPETGDNSHIQMYLIIMVISGMALLFLISERHRQEEWERECAELENALEDF